MTVTVGKVCLAFGDRDILKDVSLHLTKGSRAALAGANGSGKSTLMKVLAGELSPDSGDRAMQRGTRISYLPQSGIVHRGKSLRDEAETAFAHIHELIDKAEKIAVALQDAKSDDASSKALLEDHHRLQEQIENSGYYSRGAEISSVLAGFGFSPNDLDRDTGEFSGGWQMRIALAKALLERPDILLLDEPTNYLDIEARGWLENWLAKFPGGCLLVSHDRYFLDVTVNEVYEIFQGNLKRYAGNYSAYEKTRQQELAGLMKRYAEQQEEIAKTEALIRRFRYKATKAAFAQELIKRLEKMERVEIPENLKRISITFPPPPHSPRVAFNIEGLGKSYGAKRVLDGLDLTIDSGERLVVAGVNGAGKTTLLRILAGKDNDFEGTVKFGAGISAGYFSQDAAEALNGSEQVLEYMEANAPTALIPKIRDMLGAFLFRGDDVYKSVSVLSGGEKSRLALLYMLLKPLNLLILDEPTNHLDLHSKDILLETLNKFKGTIVFVSHDRAFMEGLSTKTLVLGELSPSGDERLRKPGVVSDSHLKPRARLYFGGYAYYLEKLGMRSEELGIEKKTSRRGAEDAEEEGRGKEEEEISAMELRALNKQRQAEARRVQRREEELLNAIEELEKEKVRLEAELSLPEVYSNGVKAKAVKLRLDECVAEIEAKTAEWGVLGELSPSGGER